MLTKHNFIIIIASASRRREVELTRERQERRDALLPYSKTILAMA